MVVITVVVLRFWGEFTDFVSRVKGDERERPLTGPSSSTAAVGIFHPYKPQWGPSLFLIICRAGAGIVRMNSSP